MSRALVLAMLPSRVGAILLGSMGLLGLLLASVGLYGTLLYAVSRRIREIGLRVALGATPAGILLLVIRQSVTPLALGLGIGILLAVYAVRPLAMFLIPDVRPTDAANFVVTAAVLTAVALAATLAPALRALPVDPMVALRHEQATAFHLPGRFSEDASMLSSGRIGAPCCFRLSRDPAGTRLVGFPQRDWSASGATSLTGSEPRRVLVAIAAHARYA
jgi:hypothetical protein